MRKIDLYIRDLLILHDCVIIPEFGGFVGNYESAVVIDKDYFMPPRKRIAFNPQLKNNDGLLANTIVTIEGISYKQAMERIQNYTANINKVLKSSGIFTLDNVGTLKQSMEQTLVFEPNTTQNFLATSIGMDTFHTTPIALNLNISKEKDTEKKSLFFFPIFKNVAIAGVCGIALLSLLMNQDNTETPGLASIAPSFSSQQTTAGTIAEEMPSEENVTTETITERTAGNEIISKEIATPETVKNYHVIVGCFSSMENAEKQREQLKVANINSHTFSYSNNLIGVSVGDFETFNEAKLLMNKLRNTGKASSAWVLKRKI